MEVALGGLQVTFAGNGLGVTHPRVNDVRGEALIPFSPTGGARVYFDYGCALGDLRAACKPKGEA